MASANEHFLSLPGNYLFREIAQRVERFKASHPGAQLIRLGIGDVTRPLPRAAVEAMQKAAAEMGEASTFRGYGPEQGYDFLRRAILEGDFAPRGIGLSPDEIFVSDGAKSDTGNFGDILGTDNRVGLTDPVYPVYADSNAMAGRAGKLQPDGRWSRITYLPCTAENHFIPALPRERVDIVYLCYPNNPTGTTLSRTELQRWVDYALAHDALILYDAAYEAYIREPDVPHSIYEIEGARQCAVEFRSFSKTAGFTGVRCGYTVVPEEVEVSTAGGKRVSLNHLWNRRQSTKFNGTSYITQRGAEAVYSPEGRRQTGELIGYYMGNAHHMRSELLRCGLEVYGGTNAPYLWVKTPDSCGSWEFFDRLLRDFHIVCTPGAGFGPSGEGYVRLTAFGTREDCLEAMVRLRRGL